jgi:hypothetical protein
MTRLRRFGPKNQWQKAKAKKLANNLPKTKRKERKKVNNTTTRIYTFLIIFCKQITIDHS